MIELMRASGVCEMESFLYGTAKREARYYGIEIDPEYCEIARKRIGADAPLFAEYSASGDGVNP